MRADKAAVFNPAQTAHHPSLTPSKDPPRARTALLETPPVDLARLPLLVAQRDLGGPTAPGAEPRTVCHHPAQQSTLVRGELADRFVAQHRFTTFTDDVLHATVTYACDYRQRVGLPWNEFPVEAFIGVALPSELYGFDRLRKQIVRALPFFFGWLFRRGELTHAASTRMRAEARGVYKAALIRTRALPGAPSTSASLPTAPPESWSKAHLTPPSFATAETMPGRGRITRE